jgi:hypothetical protein
MNITRKRLDDTERINHTARLFGVHFPLRLEPFIFDMAGRLSPDYHGGYWHMYLLNNNGFYMAPESDTVFQVSCMNGYEGKLSADAFGITVCLYAYSHLSFASIQELAEACIDQFYLLRDYILDHPEVEGILAAID